jgi:carbonic anhydrase/acetyltransferase-like protein (isoleucine patch superfamily)
MAIRTFNSVGGFSVGEVPTNVIYPNGDITTSNVVILSKVDVGNISNSSGNLTVGYSLTAGNIRTDNLLYANGSPWDLQQAQGSNGYIQYNDGANNFGSSSNLIFYSSNGVLATSNINATGNILASNILANNLSNTQVLFSGANGLLTGNANFTYSTIDNKLSVSNLLVNTDATVNGNLTVKGSLTSLQTTNTTINDNTVTLNKGETGSGVSLGTSGLEVDRGTASANATLLWTEAANAWVFKLGTSNANVTAGNIVIATDANIGGNLSVTANITANNFVGNLSGNVSGNLQAPGNNTEILFNDATAIKSAPGITYNKTSNLVTLSGNISVGNINNLSNVVYSNGGYITSPTANSLTLTAPGTNGKIQLTYNDGVANTTLTANINGVDIGVGSNHWTFGTTGDLTAPSNIFANTGLIRSNTLYVVSSGNIRGDVELGGNLNVASTTNILGDLTVGNTTPKNANITGSLRVGANANIVANLSANNLNITTFVSSNLTPSTNETYNLGNTTNRWKDLWLSGNSIQLGNTSITSGSSNSLVTSNANIYTSLLVGNTDTTGYITIGNMTNRQSLTVSGNSNITITTAATSTTSGALQVAGGVGVGGNIYVGGATANIIGNLMVGNATTVSNANITGDLTLGGSANVAGNVSITGNLLVTGSTTYLDVTNTSIKDALIDLGGAGRGANASGNDGNDRGLLLRNFTTVPVNQFIGWKTGNTEFQMLTNVTDSANVVTGTLANLRLDTLYGNHIYGTIETGNQPNVANLLGLYNANLSNQFNANNANISTLVASTLKYPRSDGSVPGTNEVVVMKTDGATNLGFTTIKTDRISNGTSNVLVTNNGNINLTAGGNTSLIVTSVGANVVGNMHVTGAFTAGNIQLDGINSTTVEIGNSTIRANTFTTTTITDDQVIAEFSATGIRAVDFLVKGEDTTGGKYSVASVSAVHNGTDIAFDVYGTVQLGGYVGKLSVGYSGGNIKLLVKPASTNSTVWTTQYRTI